MISCKGYLESFFRMLSPYYHFILVNNTTFLICHVTDALSDMQHIFIMYFGKADPQPQVEVMLPLPRKKLWS